MPAEVGIYAILARSAPRAVVFRRGPSKRVLLLSWNTDTDQFVEGQWLKGRIYERRCDLSPDGELLLYFAATYREPYYSWSALSKPPHLTALALWPKGDSWGGGGHFESKSRIALNHRQSEMTLADGFRLPKRLTIVPFGAHSGWGEDHPVWTKRLERDGWTLLHPGTPGEKSFDPPITWAKPHPISPERYTLQMTIHNIHVPNGPWYLTRHAVVSAEGESHRIGRSSWADWAPSGDLLFAKRSCLYRLEYARGELASLERAREIVNLSGQSFVAREPTAEAGQWPRR
ncbi:MAG TPA: hypothetical protein VKB93_07390 [Thermoanaerobaculia bacterium]|nr:hypothetical protein [Thermoanaerobaculia bacterium]